MPRVKYSSSSPGSSLSTSAQSADQDPSVPRVWVPGRIRKVGFYSDCLPSLVIKIDKNEAGCFMYSDTERVGVTININGLNYTAGFRTTPKMGYVKMCPDIEAEDGSPARLAEVLLRAGFRVNQQVSLRLQDEVVFICEAVT